MPGTYDAWISDRQPFPSAGGDTGTFDTWLSDRQPFTVYDVAVAVASGDIFGSSTGIATVVGVLTGNGYIDSAIAGAATVSGTLLGSGFINGFASGLASVTGIISGSVLVEGSASGAASVSGTLKAKGYLEGTAAGVASVEGDLSGLLGEIEGTTDGVATVSGALRAAGYLRGSISGTSSATAIYSAKIKIFGVSAGTSIASGTLSVNSSGLASGLATVTGTLIGTGYLVGTAVGSSTASSTAFIPEEVGEGVPLLSAGIWRKQQPNTILFVLSDSNGTEVTGLGSTFTLRIRKIGGSFISGAGTKSEVGLGWYQYVSTAGEANTSGPIAIVVTGAGVIQQNLEYVVEDRVVGAVEFTYTLTNSSNSDPIPSADVSFSISASPEDTVWRGITDAFGMARDLNGNLPRLTPGTYFIFSYKPGFIFEVDSEAVSA